METVFFAKALSDPTRQIIMELICCDWKNVTEIVDAVGVKQSTVSHHLAILREADLVNTRSEGKHIYYQLNHERVETCCGKILQVFAPKINNE